MNSTREERPLRPHVDFAVFFIAPGVLFLATGFNQPSIANMRTVDLLRLTGSGANLGAGLALLVLHFVGRRTGEAACSGKAIATPADAIDGCVPKTPDFGTPLGRAEAR
jgi:hypothetical protein